MSGGMYGTWGAAGGFGHRAAASQSGSTAARESRGKHCSPNTAAVVSRLPAGVTSGSAAGAGDRQRGGGVTVGQAVFVIYVPPQHLARSVDGKEGVVVIVSDASQALAIGGGGGRRRRRRKRSSSGSSRNISPRLTFFRTLGCGGRCWLCAGRLCGGGGGGGAFRSWRYGFAQRRRGLLGRDFGGNSSISLGRRSL